MLESASSGVASLNFSPACHSNSPMQTEPGRYDACRVRCVHRRSNRNKDVLRRGGMGLNMYGYKPPAIHINLYQNVFLPEVKYGPCNRPCLLSAALVSSLSRSTGVAACLCFLFPCERNKLQPPPPMCRQCCCKEQNSGSSH